MLRIVCMLAVLLTGVSPVLAESEEMERLASKISEEIRSNLLAIETKVAYVGKEGSRAYLIGDLATVRPGQSVIFYRDGAAILSGDPPQILGRESLEVGRGMVAAIHDRTAWVQIDTTAKSAVVQGDWAVVQLDIPTLQVIPFFMDEGRGTPKEDGRGRILRSLVLYNLKRRGLNVLDAPLQPGEVDASGLPLPATLSQFDTSGVLLIGRLLPNTSWPDELIVGIALYDLSLKDMRFARSYQVKTLAAFAPLGSPSRKSPDRQPVSGQAVQDKAVSPSPQETKEPADLLKGIARLYVSSSLRMEWPPKTPADEIIVDLVSSPLSELAVEWVEDTPGTVRIVLPPVSASVPFGAPLTAQRVVEHLTARSRRGSAQSLIGNSAWTAASDNEIVLKLDTPVSDIRDRLMDPEFRLLTDLYEPIAYGVGPYRIAARGVRSAVLEKLPSTRGAGLWSKAPDTLILTMERDPKKRTAGFVEGKADIHEIADDEYLKFGPASRFRTIQSSPEELMVLAFNLRRAPGTDVHFRRMIAMVLDRKPVLELSLNQRGIVAEGMMPQGAKDVAPVLVKLPEKLLSAAQVLVKDHSDTGRLVLIFPVEEPHYGLVAESIRSDLSALPLLVEPQGLSWRAYADRLSAGDYDLALATLVPAPPFRLWFQKHFSSTGKDNLWGYRNTIVDALVSESGDLGAAQDLIQSELPVVPLFWLSRRIALGPRVAVGWPSSFPSKFFSSLLLK